ncbi:MAG: Lrp/AsnC family transcriptional regulator [Candidatus Methylarchaceae archaeon HK01B]|nr:Lrp/AsnC family transcriptional regulator [Candidatus Methylarchaceae archaeon HK01M]MCP8312020.1 Lrp/AsnC family transcriptional regulator [Candidatus Methylarchaceae archaeon HK02M1]MCP8319213.1 Lrp/AsnC family transcriptional regulator [Candidatus Methylarchaceae archaeon HK01B]
MDKVDQQIIDVLKEKSRLPYGAIGKKVGLSEAAVRKRIKKLIANGVIKKFTIDINVSKSANAIVLISLSPTTSSSAISKKLCELDGIKDIHEVTGQYDIFVNLSAHSIVEVNKCIDEIRSIDGITNTNTMIILKSWA